MWSIFDIIVFVGGFAACWFAKDRLIKSYDGAANFVRRLGAKAKAIGNRYSHVAVFQEEAGWLEDDHLERISWRRSGRAGLA